MQMFDFKDVPMMKNNDKFDIKSFDVPDVSFAPVYVWVWNDICTKEIIDTQLNEMLNLGIRAFYILPEPKNFRPDSMPTNLEPDYLSPDFFELCAYAVKKGKEMGMHCWIYDEGGWPSGGACGKVLEHHPEFARRTLDAYERAFCAGDVYKKTPDIIAAFLNDGEIIEDGYVFSENAVVSEYIEEKTICGKTDYPDLLNKEATEYFIEITHNKYASSIKDSVGDSVFAVFTDEPKAPAGAFNKALTEKYEAVYNESVVPYLPLIAEKVTVTEENVHILHRWYDLCSQMFCENFLLACKKWANEHSMAFTGHMDMDHNPLGCINGGGNFNLMRALRCFDIPGIDVIRRQIYPEGRLKEKDEFNAYNGFFPRYASSAAAHIGTKAAMSEIFGVTGTAVPYDIMRFIIGYQAVRGINIFNLFNFPLGRKGQLLAQELPVFTENQPYYKFLASFNRYIERLSYVSSLGKRVCETGLYYPVSDFQGGLNAGAAADAFDTLGRALEDMMVDFDVVDDDVIQNSDGIDSGYIIIGNAAYRHIIIPDGAFVPKSTQQVLDRFKKGGGRVSNTLTQAKPVIRVEGDGLRAMHRKADNAQILCLFREKGKCDGYKIHLPSSKGYLLDLESGKLKLLQAKNGVLKLNISVGETAVILLTDEKFDADTPCKYTNKFDISRNFTFRKATELILSEDGFENIDHNCNATAVTLGNWSDLTGIGYSGSGIYEATFTLPAESVGKTGELDLGEVRFAAEVFINGCNLSAALMPPYKVKIPADVLKQENTIKITVTNTSANLYAHTDFFDKWSVKELSPYFDDELAYSNEFLSGGLFGPVMLYT